MFEHEHTHEHEPLTPEQEQGIELYDTAEKLYSTGQYTQCIAVLYQVLALLPDESEAWRLRGNTMWQQGLYEEAHQSLVKACQLDECNWEAVADMAALQALRGKLSASLKNLDLILTLELGPEDRARQLISRAFTLTLMGQLEDAYAGYNEAYQLDPTGLYAAGALLSRGNVAARLGRFESARSDYDCALVLDPDDANNAWMAFWAHMSEEGKNRQITDTAHAVQLCAIRDLEPESYIAKLCIGLLTLSEGHPEIAQIHFAAAAQQEPDQWDPPFWQGLALALQDDREQAQQAIDQALTMGLPPMLIIPLYWTQSNQPFFESYAAPLLQSFGL